MIVAGCCQTNANQSPVAQPNSGIRLQKGRSTQLPQVDVMSSNGQPGYLSQRQPSIVWLDEHWALRFEMDPSVETEECASYCFRYVYVSEGKLVERYISEW